VKRGKTGTAMTVERGRRPRCRHVWTEWMRSGVFDPTERRDCEQCGRIETRKATR
jgi:hypothetical protein